MTEIEAGSSSRDLSSIRPPSLELLQLADTLDDAIGHILQARSGLVGADEWEAPREAWAMSNLLIRNIEAVLLMARTDEVMVSAAWANARCAFEQGVRIIWLLKPTDRYASEGRWLGFLAEAERFHRLVAEAAEQAPELPNSTAHRELEQKMRHFREQVTAALPAGYAPKKPPKFESMLREIDAATMYRFYREGSQYVHGSMWGTATYRKNLGTHAVYGDFSTTADWILPLRLSWLSLRNVGMILLNRLAPPDVTPTCDWEALERSVNRAFEVLATSIAPGRPGQG
ncbi:DUF5677 domain-containing protein [Streptomyces sp. NBC_00656]|uniref:DUF5677 domain-containing protein n=1 Tax=Streptomyces sp. NBC_00656 TaxID=2903668 RepID=UPI00324A836B